VANGDNRIAKKLQEKFPGEIIEWSEFRGDLVVVIKRDKSLDIIRTLKEDEELKFEMLLDVCGVDYLGRSERFEVVYHLLSLKTKHRIRIKIRVSEEDPVVDSVTPVFKCANWFEREAFDMYGIRFRNHPNLTRLLCHEEFQGHALRKDHVSTQRTRCTRVIPLEPE
jgi:NADH/F420H2 dehydrogenase subunit C